MSRGTFSDTLIRLEAFKRIFVFRPKIDFCPLGLCSNICQPYVIMKSKMVAPENLTAKMGDNQTPFCLTLKYPFQFP